MSAGDKVHLMDLRLRTPAAGNQYLSGWLGRAAVVGFRDRSPFTPSRSRRPSRRRTDLQPGDLEDRLDDL